MENSEQIAIKCQLSNSNPAVKLGVKIKLDGQVVYETDHVKEVVEVEHKFNDNDGNHEFAIEMFGKLSEHTKIDNNGNIIEDAVITVKNISIDDLDISQIVQELGKYHHDYNGTKSPTVEKFYNTMGCNGTVKLEFTTPIYIWLLESI
jgi:hypothetical protein